MESYGALVLFVFVNNEVQKFNKCTYFANSGSILGKRSNLLKLKGLTLPPQWVIPH